MKKLSFFSRIALTASVLAVSVPFNFVNAASLTTGSLSLADARPTTASVTYTFQFSGVTLSTTKCLKVQFSDTATGTNKPAGMTLTGAALSATSNYMPTPASWTATPNNATGTVQVAYTTGEIPASASSRTLVLTGITNGSTAATTYFAQFSTYSNNDCATGPIDNATVAFIYVNGQAVSATVDPTLSFSIAGVASSQTVNGSTTTVTSTTSTIPLGTLSTGTNAIAAQDLTVGTNANSGYTVTIKYTGALTGGSHAMTDFTGTNASPTTFSAAGTEAFGYTTNATALGTGTAGRFTSNKWAGFTTSPLEVAYSSSAASATTRIGYQVGISSTTPSGAYSTTIVFVATPTY